MFDIQKKVPVPTMLVRGPRGPQRKYPFESMRKGDMFFVPGKMRNTMTRYVSAVGKELGIKFITRLCYMKQTIAGWEPCEEGVKGATLGVGVWHDGPAE